MIEDNIEVNVSNTIEVVDVFPQITEEVVDINILDNREDVLINVTESIIEVNINKVTNVLSAVWGSITGTLSDQTDLQSALDDKVPYTGATENVDLGEFGAKVGHLGFDITPTSIPTGIGTTYWDAFYRTLSLVDGDGDTTLQIGQEERVLVHNNTGVSLTDGQVVYVTGSTGELPSVALASNTTETTSSVTFGVVTETILNGNDGFITTSGIIHGLNTLAYTEGSAIWLGSTAGTFTDVKPIAPLNSVLVGYVIKKAGGNGSIFVKIQNGVELDELHNVLISSVANNQGIFWDSATSLWKNKTIATVLGYTPISGTGTTNYLPKFTGSTSIGNSLIYDNGTNVGIGLTSPSFKLDVGGEIVSRIGVNYTRLNSNQIAAFSSGTPSVLYINYSGGNTLLNSTSGSVGIGTTSPTSKLQINSGVANQFSFIDGDKIGFSRTSDGAEIIYLKKDASLGINQGTANLWGYDGIQFKTQGAETVKMSITSSGLVGIGTTSPSLGKVVSKDSGFQFIAEPTDTTTYGYFGIGHFTNGTFLGTYAGTNAASNILRLGTSGTEKMRIDASGSVGIGTTSPAFKLDVEGNIVARSGVNYTRLDNNQIAAFSSGTPSALYVNYSGGNTLLNSTSGNVGIGTTSPTAKLHVLGAAGNGIIYSDSTITGYFGTSSGGYLEVGTLTNHSYSFLTNGTERMRITTSGSLGIGTTSPLASLDVVSNSNANGINIRTRVNNDYGFLNFKSYNASETLSEIYVNRTGANLASLIFTTNNGSSPAERMRITSGGSVGIGITSPTQKLSVAGNIYANGGFIGYRTDGGIGLEVNGGDLGSASYIAKFNDYSNNTKVVINGIGSVGIGTTSPTEKLDVNGVIKSNNDIISTNGTISSILAYSSSYGAVFGSITNHNANIYTNSLPRLTVNTAGSVGIGTTSPAQKLHVVGGIRGEYYSSVNNKGLNQIVDFIDLDNYRYQLTFEDGILVDYVVT